jgi:hypothetical protein
MIRPQIRPKLIRIDYIVAKKWDFLSGVLKFDAGNAPQAFSHPGRQGESCDFGRLLKGLFL